MASFFKGRGEGSSPPTNDSSSPNSNSKKWISGLVSGAGKIISSVFASSDDASDSEFDEDDAEMLSSGLFLFFQSLIAHFSLDFSPNSVLGSVAQTTLYSSRVFDLEFCDSSSILPLVLSLLGISY